MSDSRLRLGACLSLSGKYARFGRQAGLALDIWRSTTGAADLLIEDDGSDPERLAALLPRLSAECDLLLGPCIEMFDDDAALSIDPSVQRKVTIVG